MDVSFSASSTNLHSSLGQWMFFPITPTNDFHFLLNLSLATGKSRNMHEKTACPWLSFRQASPWSIHLFTAFSANSKKPEKIKSRKRQAISGAHGNVLCFSGGLLTAFLLVCTQICDDVRKCVGQRALYQILPSLYIFTKRAAGNMVTVEKWWMFERAPIGPRAIAALETLRLRPFHDRRGKWLEQISYHYLWWRLNKIQIRGQLLMHQITARMLEEKSATSFLHWIDPKSVDTFQNATFRL